MEACRKEHPSKVQTPDLYTFFWVIDSEMIKDKCIESKLLPAKSSDDVITETESTTGLWKGLSMLTTSFPRIGVCIFHYFIFAYIRDTEIMD